MDTARGRYIMILIPDISGQGTILMRGFIVVSGQAGSRYNEQQRRIQIVQLVGQIGKSIIAELIPVWSMKNGIVDNRGNGVGGHSREQCRSEGFI
jgi:hypothetical protein